MKKYTCVTRFGVISFNAKGLHEISKEAPYTIYYKSGKTSYPDLVSLFNKTGKKGLKDKRVSERFLVYIWHKYLRYAIEEMVMQGAKIPIGFKGHYMAIGVNKLAPARKDYKFNPKTMGIVYEPVLVSPSRLPRKIKHYYRIRFHPRIMWKYKQVLESGKVFEKQPSDPYLRKVNAFYEQRKIIKLKNVVGIKNPYPYAIKL